MGQTIQLLLRIRGNASEGLSALRSIQSALGGFGSALQGLSGLASRAGSTITSALIAPVRSAASILDSTFRTAQQSAASFLGGLTRLGIGVIAIRELGQAAAGIAGGFISGNRALEGYLAQYQTFLGSIDAARARVAELQRFNIASPFELPELIQADITLTNFGARTVEILTNVSNAAAATKKPIDEVATAIGRLNAGNFGEAFEDLRRLGIATRPLLEAEGLKFDRSGAYTGSVKQAMEAVNRIMAERFGNAAALASQTFDGIVSNVSDRIGALRTIMGAPVFDLLKTQLQGLLTDLNNPQFEAAAAFIGQGIAAGLRFAISGVQQIASAIAGFAQTLYTNLNAATGGILSFVGMILAAFAPLGAAIQAALAGDLNQAAQLVGTFVSNIASLLLSGLAGLAGDLFVGGSNTIAAYADGLISGAATYVTAAINYITGLIASFLQGFSPPKQGRLSEIDTWFGPVIDAYLTGGLTDADWSILDDLTGRIGDQFLKLVEQGKLSVQEAARLVIGTDGAQGLTGLVAQAVAEVSRTGKASAESLIQIRALLGDQYQDLFQQIQAQLQAVALNRQIGILQAELATLQDPGARAALDDALQRAQDAFNQAREQDAGSARAARDQVSLVKAQQQAAARRERELESQLKTLQAQKQAIESQLKGQDALARIQERSAQFLERLVQLQEQSAKSSAGGAAAEDRAAERFAEAQFRRQLALADTAGQLELQKQKLAGLDSQSVEYVETQIEIERLEKKIAEDRAAAAAAAEQEAARIADAEFQRQLALQDTAGQLEMQKQKLSELEEGSLAYIQKQIEIDQLERQLAQEREAANTQAATEAERLKEAWFQYALATTDTAGKLALYRGRLQELDKDSVKYVETLTTIAQLEQSLAAERAKAAGSAKTPKTPKVGGAKAGGVDALAGGGISVPDIAVPDFPDPDIPRIEAAKTKWGELWGEIDRGGERLSSARSNASEFLDTLSRTPTGQFISGLVQPVTDFIAKTREAQAASTSLSDTVRSNAPPDPFAAAVNGARAAIGAIAGVVVGVAAGIGVFIGLSSAITFLPIAIGGVTAAWATLSGILSSGGVLGVLGSIVAILGGPVTIVLGLVAAAVAAFAFAWVNNLGGARDFIAPILSRLTTLFSDLWRGIQEGATALQPAFASVIRALESLAPIGAVLVAGLLGVFGGLIGLLSELIPGAVRVFSGAIQVASGVIQVVAAVITGVVTAVINLFQGDLTGAGEALKEMFGRLGTAIGDIWNGLLTLLMGIVQGIVGGIIAYWQDLYMTLVGASIIPDTVNAIIEWFTTLDDRVIELIGGLVAAAIQLFINLGLGVITAVVSLKDRALATYTEFKDLAIALIVALATGNLTEFGRLVTEIVGKALELKDRVLERLTGLKEQAVALFGGLRDRVVEKATALKTDVIDRVSGILDHILSLPSRFYSAGTGLIENLWNGIRDRFSRLLEDMRAKLSQVTDLLNGSEPKDRTSPLYNLARRGRALVENIQDGINQRSLSVLPAISGVQDQIAATLVGVQAELNRGSLSLAVQAGGGNPVQAARIIPPSIQLIDRRTVVIQPPAGASLDEVRQIANEVMGQQNEELVQRLTGGEIFGF